MNLKDLIEIGSSSIKALKYRSQFVARFELSINQSITFFLRNFLYYIFVQLLSTIILSVLFGKTYILNAFYNGTYNDIIIGIISYIGLAPIGIFIQGFFQSLFDLYSTTLKKIRKDSKKYSFVYKRSRSALIYYRKQKLKNLFFVYLYPMITVSICVGLIAINEILKLGLIELFVIFSIFIILSAFSSANRISDYTKTDFNIEKVLSNEKLDLLIGLSLEIINGEKYYIDYENYRILYVDDSNKRIIFLSESLNKNQLWEYIAIKEYCNERCDLLESYKKEQKDKINDIKEIDNEIKSLRQAITDISNKLNLSKRQI